MLKEKDSLLAQMATGELYNSRTKHKVLPGATKKTKGTRLELS